MANSIPDGPAKILTMANKLGIPPAKANKKYPGIPDASGPDLDADALITLGKARLSPINMANAYATIDNGGQRADVHVIDKVVLRSGETYNYKAPTQDAVSQGIADDTSYALQQVVQHGTGQAALALGRPAAGKTGTATNDAGDVSSAWFIGYTPQLATAVMYVRGDGNDKLDGWLPSYFGADYPADTWTQVMQRDMAGLPVEQFPPPANVDGTAPETGHSPYVPPPLPTHTLKPSKTPTTETSTPTETPTPSDTPTTESPSPTGSPTCTILGGCHTPTPSNTPTSTSTPSSSGSASAAPRTTTMADRRRTSGDPWTW
jgi:membrane peptidoglycan carboxypeptidase